ncbi:hypothetical protein VTO42DRAFT_5122 [Malbranchea cinnamomea]
MAKRREPSNEAPQAKRAKKTSYMPASASTKVLSSSKPKTDSNGDPYWEISRLRRVTVSTFKGKTLVNIREYYEKDGQELPGKKGISMPLDQFNAFVELLPDIEEAVRQKGGSLVRPVYEGMNGSAAATEEPKEDQEEENEQVSDEDEESEEDQDEDRPTKKAKEKRVESKRSNIEATSDEDESD